MVPLFFTCVPLGSLFPQIVPFILAPPLRHTVQLISQLLTCLLSYAVDVCALFRHYSIFFAYTRMGIADIGGYQDFRGFCSVQLQVCRPSALTAVVRVVLSRRFHTTRAVTVPSNGHCHSFHVPSVSLPRIIQCYMLTFRRLTSTIVDVPHR